jgi:branched-chain amino acid transport system ATP-binding protein
MNDPVVAALETKALERSFGALRVTRAVDFRLAPGARHALIGPNGAGKTTFINLVTGAVEPSAGQIFLGGTEITHLAQEQRVRRGLTRTFQINTLFRGLSVLENVCLSIGEHRGTGGHLFRPAGSHRDVILAAYALLERLGLADDAARLVKELPYGRQRLVEIAVALGLEPKVLLLDEPAAGVPSAESGVIIEVVESLPKDLALLIIEHDMALVFRLATRITVLVQGAILVEGTPQQIAADERVREVYLGERSAR